jgi:hypothetical protein
MRRILLSLFVISAVAGVGIIATGAYFSDTITQDNYTFTTGSADLKMGFCGPIGTDCSGTAATQDNVYFTTSQLTGPGEEGSDCLVVENTGDYALTLSSQLFVTGYTHPDMAAFFQVAADHANSSCYATGNARPWNSAAGEAAAGKVSTGQTLAPGGRAYFITYNRWDSSGDQNYLQNGTLTLKTVLEGKTE